ncbi:cytochrome P450 [Phaeosphaeriaceae sp. PMI808]|nr:cytochrome P450 [Phaeosphaeriaceae sp. PMI808]
MCYAESRCISQQRRMPKTDLLDSVLSRGLNIDQAISEILIVITSSIGAPDSVIKRMPYLQAYILEGLRIYPPVFSQLQERVAPPEGAFIHGYYIPGGTYIGFNSVGAQPSHIYGDHLLEFHPERWFIDDEVRLKQMRRILDLVYGYGNSKYLGINLELNKVIFQLFSRYDVSFSNAHKPYKTRGDFMSKDFRVNLRLHEQRFPSKLTTS